MIWPGLTKSFGLAQKLSRPGVNSRQLMRLGNLRPSPQVSSGLYRKQNSQIIIFSLYREDYLYPLPNHFTL